MFLKLLLYHFLFLGSLEDVCACRNAFKSSEQTIITHQVFLVLAETYRKRQ